jgi:hypothetical protein
MEREGWAVRAVFPHISRTSPSLIHEEEEEKSVVKKEKADEEAEVKKEEEALMLAAEMQRLSRFVEDERTRGVELINSRKELEQMVHTLQYQV